MTKEGNKVRCFLPAKCVQNHSTRKCMTVHEKLGEKIFFLEKIMFKFISPRNRMVCVQFQLCSPTNFMTLGEQPNLIFCNIIPTIPLLWSCCKKKMS